MNERLINKLLDEIEESKRMVSHQMDAYAKLVMAGDTLAHCLTVNQDREALELWWNARGGHERCTVCHPIETKNPL